MSDKSSNEDAYKTDISNKRKFNIIIFAASGFFILLAIALSIFMNFSIFWNMFLYITLAVVFIVQAIPVIKGFANSTYIQGALGLGTLVILAVMYFTRTTQRVRFMDSIEMNDYNFSHPVANVVTVIIVSKDINGTDAKSALELNKKETYPSKIKEILKSFVTEKGVMIITITPDPKTNMEKLTDSIQNYRYVGILRTGCIVIHLKNSKLDSSKLSDAQKSLDWVEDLKKAGEAAAKKPAKENKTPEEQTAALDD